MGAVRSRGALTPSSLPTGMTRVFSRDLMGLRPTTVDENRPRGSTFARRRGGCKSGGRVAIATRPWVMRGLDPDHETGLRRVRGTAVCRTPAGKDAWQLLAMPAARRSPRREATMDAIIEGCCGLDVHQETVVACLLLGRADQKPRKEVRTFRTVTRELLALRDWLVAEACTHVAMESTGIYWRPVYAILEGAVELVVGNAHHMKAVPGRKTDVKDSEWIADLLRHGLIAKSFVPPKALRDLRDLLRYRRKLVESRTAERNRLLKLLETANIKLASVMSDVFGVSGMLMLHALALGDCDVENLAQLAKGRLRAKVRDLVLALDGRIDDHHRFLLGIQLRRLEQVEADLTLLEQRLDERLAAYEKVLSRLRTIPGVDRRVAAVIVAELGVDMQVFASARHVVAWAYAQETTRAPASVTTVASGRETSTSRPRS